MYSSKERWKAFPHHNTNCSSPPLACPPRRPTIDRPPSKPPLHSTCLQAPRVTTPQIAGQSSSP